MSTSRPASRTTSTSHQAVCSSKNIYRFPFVKKVNQVPHSLGDHFWISEGHCHILLIDTVESTVEFFVSQAWKA